MNADWTNVFDEAYPAIGATDLEIERFTLTIGAPLSAAEIDDVNRSQVNPFRPDDPLYAEYHRFDPGAWTIPRSPLPSSYLGFLRYSNGGEFRSGARWLQPLPLLDPLHGVRAMLLEYHVPEYMPGALPFAFDGGGTFYLFDMRRPPDAGEYPIVCAHAGSLAWDPEAFWQVATTFVEACTGKEDIYAIKRGGA